MSVVNTMNTDQAASREQSDLGPDDDIVCNKGKQTRDQRTQVLNG